MAFKILQLSRQDLLDLLPRDIKNIVQYVQSGGTIVQKTYKLLPIPQCGIVDCLKKECVICRAALTKWRKAVKERDHYACKNCGPGKSVQAHHMLQRINFPEKAFDVNNGITLCDDCHRLAHKARRAD